MTEGQDIKENCSTAIEPGFDAIRSYLIYGLSLPERTMRSSAVLLGGAINESGALLLPQSFRDSKSYQTLVQQMLNVLTRELGGVVKRRNGDAGTIDPAVENYVARKTVGSFVDLAGLATLHVSPVVILAVVADLAYGSTTYLRALAEELKEQGVIAENSTINSSADLLDAIGKFSSQTADVLDTPPINVEGWKQVIKQTQEKLAGMDASQVVPQAEIDSFWQELERLATQQHVDLLGLSSALTFYTLDKVGIAAQGAIATVMVTGALLDRHVLKHYWDGLEAIAERGLYSMLAESSQPYIEAVWKNYSSSRPTVTEDLVTGRLAGRLWTKAKRWLAPQGADEKGSE